MGDAVLCLAGRRVLRSRVRRVVRSMDGVERRRIIVGRDVWLGLGRVGSQVMFSFELW